VKKCNHDWQLKNADDGGAYSVCKVCGKHMTVNDMVAWSLKLTAERKAGGK